LTYFYVGPGFMFGPPHLCNNLRGALPKFLEAAAHRRNGFGEGRPLPA